MNSQSTATSTTTVDTKEKTKIRVANHAGNEHGVVVTSPSQNSVEAAQKVLVKDALFVEHCKERGFVGISFARIDTFVNKTGAVKKKPVGLPGRQSGSIHKDNFTSFVKRGDQAFAIITGAVSDITVIDCDSHESYQQMVRDFPELHDTYTVRTAKGFHLYVKYDAAVVGNTHSFQSYPNVDIRNDDGLIFAPPTTYKNCKTLAMEEYSASNIRAEIKDFPKGLLADLKNYAAGAKAKTSKKPELPSKADVEDVEEEIGDAQSATGREDRDDRDDRDDREDREDREDHNFFAVNELQALEREIRGLVERLDVRHATDRTEWVKIGAIIHRELGNTANARQLFLEFSRRADAFKPIQWAEIAPVWTSFERAVNRSRNRGPVTIQTLRHMCKDHQTPMCTLADEPFDFGLITTTSLAQYFVRQYGADFIQTSSLITAAAGQSMLVWWDGNIWNAAQAQRRMMQLIGNDLFLGLQQLAFATIKDDHYKASVLKQLVKLQDRRFKEQVMKDVLTAMEMKDIEFDTNREQDDNLQYLNGVLMLNHVSIGPNNQCDTSRAFRPRTRDDFVTKTLDWEFGPVHAEAYAEVQEMFRQIQPNEEQRRLQLGYLAYSLTGHMEAQKFKINIGYSASNGKSFECVAHENSFGLYTTKLHKATFTEGNPKAHKFLIELLLAPIRLAYIEELNRNKVDADMLKDFVSGGNMTVEVMFGTKATRRIQAKLVTNSNKDINVDVDKGVLRRGMMQYYESQFVERPDPSTKPLQFLKVDGLERRFLQTRYRRAYLELLLPHVVDYYCNGLHVPAFAGQQFESVTNEYDAFKTALFDVCEVGAAGDSIWKDDLVEALKPLLGRHWVWTKVLPEIKRLGYAYRPHERARPRDEAASLKMKGAVIGLRWIVPDGQRLTEAQNR